jgi:hypothetical protein
MLPSRARQATALFGVVPDTVAVNVTVPLTGALVEIGLILIELTVGDGWGAVVIVTGAEADLVGSATLVAVTKPVPAPGPAMYRPLEVIVPEVAVQLTALSVVVPSTVDVN